jgi:hypothetical protein
MSWNSAPKWVRPTAFILFTLGAVGLKLTSDIDLGQFAGNIVLGFTLVSGLIGTIIGKNGGSK